MHSTRPVAAGRSLSPNSPRRKLVDRLDRNDRYLIGLYWAGTRPYFPTAGHRSAPGQQRRGPTDGARGFSRGPDRQRHACLPIRPPFIRCANRQWFTSSGVSGVASFTRPGPASPAPTRSPGPACRSWCSLSPAVAPGPGCPAAPRPVPRMTSPRSPGSPAARCWVGP